MANQLLCESTVKTTNAFSYRYSHAIKVMIKSDHLRQLLISFRLDPHKLEVNN